MENKGFNIGNLIGEKGVKFEVGLKMSDILIMVSLLFVAMILAGFLTVIINKNLKQ